MRWAFILSIASCYQGPRPVDECTSACDAMTSEGTSDAPSDAAPQALCRPLGMPTAHASVLSEGEWFIPRLVAETYAVRYVRVPDPNGTGTMIGQIEGTSGNIAGPYAVMFQDAAGAVFSSPRLSPSGTELFMIVETSLGIRLRRATRTVGTNTWSAASLITTVGYTIDADDSPSPPTTTTPRRMVISSGMSSAIELQENGSTTWASVANSTISGTFKSEDSVTNVAFQGHATLSPDGRRLVFRGRGDADSFLGVFYVERATVQDPFQSPARKILGPGTDGSVSFPYLAPDCSAVFYTNADTQVYRDTYP